MVQASRTFRVFVSSTFDDLKAERNALQEEVFPRLATLCAKNGTRFQAIDLRWGVSEEAGLDQQTMAICLDEVRRCQKASPKPNFIVLLGDRYGWCPLPASIEAREFEEIKAKVPAEEQALIVYDEARPADGNGWYRKDYNAVPVTYLLRERRIAIDEGASDEEKRAAHDLEEASWRTDEVRIRVALRRAVDALGWPTDDERRRKYETSATEQEILHGALGVADAPEHVFGFVRTIENLDDLVADIGAAPSSGEADPDRLPPERFVDLTPDRFLDERARQRLGDLKARLDGHLRAIRGYPARWEDHRISTEHLDRLCEDVYEALAGVISTEIGRIRARPPLEKEIEDHERFGEDRAGARFVGRRAPLEAIETYIASGDDHLLALVGASGSGKSALMAAAAKAAGERADDSVVLRFIGATPDSSSGRSLLNSVCRQIAHRYASDGLASAGGDDPGPQGEDDIPADYRELSAEFPRQLVRATEARPLVIFLDALDQLSQAEGARGLSWLPRTLPEHVRMIVSTSTSPSDCLEVLTAKLPAGAIVELAPMSHEEGEDLLGVWLGLAGRRLQPTQQDYLLDRFASAGVGEGEEEDQGGLPLYLKLAFEEARRWRSYDGVPDLRLHPTIRGVIRDNLFARLSAEANHGGVFIRHALGYLGAAKNGLTEDEMLDVLSHDPEVLADFRRRSPRSPAVERLPVAVWSRLFFDLEPYLTERSADETTLIGFYHRQLGEVVEQDYLAGDAGLARHMQLAEQFSLPESPDATFTLRQMSELPYQETRAELWGPLFETLTNFRFLEQKAATGAVRGPAAGGGMAATSYTGIFAIHDDFDLALAAMPGGDADAIGDDQPVIIVTATDLGTGAGIQIRCPFCDRYSDVDEEWLGTVQHCPHAGCGRQLRVNPFKVPSTFETRDLRPRGPAPATTGQATTALLDPPSPPTDAPAEIPAEIATPTASPAPVPRFAQIVAPDRTVTLASLLAGSGLKSQEVGGAHVLRFAADRSGPLEVLARELPGGLLGLYLGLPDVRRKKDRAYRNLLEASFQASYTKAFRQDSGALVLAAEVPLATLSPETFAGICTGLAAMGDVNRGDLTADRGLRAQLAAAGYMQAVRINLATDQESDRAEAMLTEAGWPCRRVGQGVLTTISLMGNDLNCLFRPLPTCISFIVGLGGVRPTGEEKLGRLLALNRTDVAKVGLDSDGDVVLLYEVPALYDGLLDHLVSQFTPLLLGAMLAR